MPAHVLVDKPAALAELLAARLEQQAGEAQRQRGRFALALPGGSAATVFFPRLAQARADWSRTDFFWGDERAVAPDDPESNYGLARELWLEPAAVPAACVHRMEADRGDLDDAAADYAAGLIRRVGDPPRLDLVLVGVGPDGHVCSLFPGHPLLSEARLRVAALEDSPKPPPRRLTLTLPTLLSARLVVVAALGESKAAPIRAAIEDGDSELPVARLARGAPAVLFLLDHAAAALLDRHPPA